MIDKELLNNFVSVYSNDNYNDENIATIHNYFSKVLEGFPADKPFLELGIGHGVNLEELNKHCNNVTVIEGASSLINKYSKCYTKINFIHGLFENFQSECNFSKISMGFILEHVDDPVYILKKFKSYLLEDGVIVVAVPNAASLHRLIAFNAGILNDLNELSQSDHELGHKRFFTYSQWVEIFKSSGLKIKKSEGLYLKPFTTNQIRSLNLPSVIYQSLCLTSKNMPQISNSCYFELAL